MERRRLSEMIPKKGTCDCEKCKNYWKAGEAYWEAREAREDYLKAARKAYNER